MTGQPKGPLTVNGKILQDLIRARVSLQRVEARVFARDILPVLQLMEAQILTVRQQIFFRHPLSPDDNAYRTWGIEWRTR